MKRLNLILIVTAFFLTTACLETETVLPSQDLYTTQAITSPESSDSAERDGKNDQDCTKCNENKETDYERYGKLLPSSFLDCGTFIRRNDGKLLAVDNAEMISEDRRTAGGNIVFGYNTNEDVPPSCGAGTTIDLLFITFNDN